MFDNNRKLSNEAKFKYLFMFTQGEARSLVHSCKEDYVMALESLHDRYGQVRTLVDDAILRFQNLEKAENFREFTRLYDESNASLLSMEALGEDIPGMSKLLISILRRKLPGRVHEAWVKFEEKQALQGKIVTIMDMRGFLRIEQRIWAQKENNKRHEAAFSRRKTKTATTLMTGAESSRYEEHQREHRKGGEWKNKHDSYNQVRNRGQGTQRGNEQRSKETGTRRKTTQPRTRDDNPKGKERGNFNEYKKPKPKKLDWCFACGMEPWHPIGKCQAAPLLHQKVLWKLARSDGACFRCLETGHLNSECTAPPCGHCGNNHHSLLHTPLGASTFQALNTVLGADSESEIDLQESDYHEEGEYDEERSSTPEPSDTEQQYQNIMSYHTVTLKNRPLVNLQTMKANVVNEAGESVEALILLDTASDTSYVSKRVTEALGLQGEKMKVNLISINDNKKRITQRLQFKIEAKGKSVELTALELEKIAEPIRQVEIDPKWEHVKTAKLNPAYKLKGEHHVDVLVGIDSYFDFVTGNIKRGENGQPVLVETIFNDYILCGNTKKCNL